MSVDIIWHPTSLQHDPGAGHPESPARVEAIVQTLRAPGCQDLVRWYEADPAPVEVLERVHPPGHLERLEAVAARGGGRLDEDTVMSAGSWEAARHGAGAAIEVARRALSGTPAFAPVRPPGHHATADRAMGFCLVNNVVVAARAALDDFDAGAVLIVDWDVHHGNGTQDLVERDARIRYVSLHQWPLYPGTGREAERGVGNIFNVPRPPGLPRRAYTEALDTAVREATTGWTPDLILISAGFDAMAGDPLAGFTLEPEDYGAWVQAWKAIGAPMGAVLEGGYTPARIAVAAEHTVRALAP